MTEWHYAIKGEQRGPASPQELRELARKGQLSPSDLVWQEGMETWVEASHVRGLFEGNLPNRVPMHGPPPPPHAQSSSSPEPNNRSHVPSAERNDGPMPLGVVLIAMYSVVGALLSLGTYYSLAFVAGVTQAMGSSRANSDTGAEIMLGFVAILIIVVALLQATVAYGLFALQKWSHMLTVLVYGFAGVVGLIGLLVAASRQAVIQQVPNIIAAIVVILYMSQPRIKAYFEAETH